MVADGTRFSKSSAFPSAAASFPSPRGRHVGLAVIVPAYDEVNGIAETLDRTRDVLAGLDCVSEVIVVDDGSTDGTGEAAANCGARVISHSVNRGYGAALKTGILSTSAPAVLIMDADCTYRPEAIPKLYALLNGADMVVGSRELTSSGVLWIRRPAKWFLNRYASFLVGRPVPDLNSGQRVMKRDVVLRYLHLMPDGFSFTSTITLAMLTNGHPVIYQPIEYDQRRGDSKIRAVHFLDFLLLIMRAMILFNPLRIFLPISGVLFLIGTAMLALDIARRDLSETTVMALLSALVVWVVGLLAETIARLHMRPPQSDI